MENEKQLLSEEIAYLKNQITELEQKLKHVEGLVGVRDQQINAMKQQVLQSEARAQRAVDEYNKKTIQLEEQFINKEKLL